VPSALLDHDYVASVRVSNTFIQGTNPALDVAVSTAREFDEWLKIWDANETSYLQLTSENVFAIENAIRSRNVKILIETIMTDPTIHSNVIHFIIRQTTSSLSDLNRRKNGYVSSLMRKDLCHLTSFSWSDLFVELTGKMPDLARILLLCSMKPDRRINPFHLNNAIPKLSMVYGVLANNFNMELSVVQRLLACILHESCCDKLVSVLTNSTMNLCIHCIDNN